MIPPRFAGMGRVVTWKHVVIVVIGVLLVARVASELTGRGAPYWHYDLRAFYREQTTFYQHVYPHEAIAPATPGHFHVRSDYPPSSYWLFLPIMPPGLSLGAAELWFTLCQILATLAWVAFAWSVGRRGGAMCGVISIGAVLAITGLRADLLFGNFALIATGLLLGLLVAARSQRWWWAGAFWAAAMLKPQIGWAFALLFLHRTGWRPLLAGGVLLSISAWAACSWTHVSLWSVLRSGGLQNWSTIVHVAERNSLTTLIAGFGVSPQIAIAGCAIAAVAIVTFATYRSDYQADFLQMFAFVALINRIFVYHNVCDDLLVGFALLWWGRRACSTNRSREWAMFALLGLTVWLPTSVMTTSPVKLTVLVIWGVAAICMGWREPGKAADGGCGPAAELASE